MATQVLAAGTAGVGYGEVFGQASGRTAQPDASPAMEGVRERNRTLLALQQRMRRGPTPEVLFAKRLDNTRLVRTEDPVRVREMRIFAAAATVLFFILMAYGWRQFRAIECGYRVEAEKQQRESLQEENRRLRLDEARLCDPGRIDQMARQMGLDAPQPGQVVDPGSGIDGGGPALAEASPAPANLR